MHIGMSITNKGLFFVADLPPSRMVKSPSPPPSNGELYLIQKHFLYDVHSST